MRKLSSATSVENVASSEGLGVELAAVASCTADDQATLVGCVVSARGTIEGDRAAMNVSTSA